MIDADKLLAFLNLLDNLEQPQTAERDTERAWAIQQVRAYVLALSEPEPTFREIEAASRDPRWCWDHECPLLAQGVWGHPVSAHEKWPAALFEGAS